jgi:serine O-acetyltransferase
MIGMIDLYLFSSRCNKLGVRMLPRVVDYFARLFFAFRVPQSATIRRGVVPSFGGLGRVIHKDAVEGEGCHIDQCVTIGGNGTAVGVPKIGRRVYIGAGAKILGDIRIGDGAVVGAVVGANSVVIRDVEENAVVVGVPARVVRINPASILDDDGEPR